MVESTTSTSSPTSTVERDATALMIRAVAAHKVDNHVEAERLYRETLKLGPHPGAAILLANLLLTASSSSQEQRTEALVLSRIAMQGVETRAKPEKIKLYSRHAYFLLQYTGYVQQFSGDMPTVLVDEETRFVLLKEAIENLEKVVALDANTLLAWKNLTLAYTAAGRLEDAVRSAGAAVKAAAKQSTSTSSSSSTITSVPWELHYKHGKTLKRVGRVKEALEKYCDACEAAGSQGTTADVVLYWLRISEVAPPPPEGLTPALKARIRQLLKTYTSTSSSLSSSSSTTSSSSSGAGANSGNDDGHNHDNTTTATSHIPHDVLVPHEYIRKLFNGYSKTFDNHLTVHLGYKTPHALLQVALEIVKQGGGGDRNVSTPPITSTTTTTTVASSSPSSSTAVLWPRAGDLGCGTGLAGVEFRPYVGYLEGCDLSEGMVAEAKARKNIYDVAEAAEIESWLAKRKNGGYQLMIAADVLVYIGSLDGVFAGVAAAMVPTTAPRKATEEEEEEVVEDVKGRDNIITSTRANKVPSLFIFSTEALGPETQVVEKKETIVAMDRSKKENETTERIIAPQGQDHVQEEEEDGFALSGTGRCVHSRVYIQHLATKYGFVIRDARRQAIRKNAGVDVVGDLFALEYVKVVA